MPLLSSVFPQGAQAGASLRVEILGQYLDRAHSVVFLDASIAGKVVDAGYTRLLLEFSVRPDAPLGPHYFRVVSPRGASNILLFRVGDQVHITENEPNTTFEAAQPISVPATINGRLNSDGDFDFFRFEAKKGQSWIFDLRSARNGNGLDAALILLDSKGGKLEHVEETFIWDPLISHTFNEDGTYCLVVQPTHVRLDPNFAYQLDIRMAPHLETLSPISIRPGSTVEATVFGAGLTGSGAKLWFDAPGFSGEVLDMRGATARVRLMCPQDAPEGPRQLAIVSSGARSNPATFLVDASPSARNGIARYREPERFPFEAKAGQTLVFEVRAHRFGSPVDSVLRILDSAGKQIARNDDGDLPGVPFNKDSLFSYTFQEAGRYQVELRNLWKTTGENFPYQLLIRPPQPGFELMLGSDNPYVLAGGTGSLKVSAVRKDGYDGPIKVQVRGLPPGVEAEPAEIPAKANDAEIRLLARDARAGLHSQIQVIAEGALEPAWRSVRISSGGGEGATFAQVRQATLAVVEKPGFSLEAAVSSLNLVRGGSAEFLVSVKRAQDFREPIQFSFENLPPGVTAAQVLAEPGSDQVKLRLQAGADAKLGRSARVSILGRAESGQTQEAPRISVVVD